MNDKKRHIPAMKKSDLPAVLDMGQISALQDVDVRITVEWGRAKITVEEAVSLGEKSLLRTDKLAPDPVDILVNDKLFARGKLVVVGGSYGVQILEIVQ
jgi:flagellar motor switch protein FliN/FliY